MQGLRNHVNLGACAPYLIHICSRELSKYLFGDSNCTGLQYKKDFLLTTYGEGSIRGEPNYQPQKNKEKILHLKMNTLNCIFVFSIRSE